MEACARLTDQKTARDTERRKPAGLPNNQHFIQAFTSAQQPERQKRVQEFHIKVVFLNKTSHHTNGVRRGAEYNQLARRLERPSMTYPNQGIA
ncbi:hypothetical protein AOLI_G00238990 [Acnodon oligacanthus]